MPVFSSRRLFIFDFVAGLMGGVIYLFAFDFLTESLGLPLWIVKTQIACNFAYGLYGLVMFATKTQNQRFYKFLISMNFAYASLCVGVGLFLIQNLQIVTGGALLVAEGAFIAILAKLEQRTLTTVPQQKPSR